MQVLHSFFFIWVLLPILCPRALDGLNKVSYTIVVDKSGGGKFTSIQSAVNSVSDNNNQWIRIRISAGSYIEKVTIPASKPYILMEGAGSKVTNIQWGDHDATNTSATFASDADNFAARGISFYNTAPASMMPAVAVRVAGDKSAFFQCAFYGIQDTIWDQQGRHYFRGCYITGAVDFIFGDGQSIYELCVLSVTVAKYYPPGYVGYLTAQSKQSGGETSGFVFKNSAVTGNGKVYLGRAYGPYSTVIFYNSTLSDVVVPAGWDPWQYASSEGNFIYAESNNRGRGADTSRRVTWEKQLSGADLGRFVDISFINSDGWLGNVPLPLQQSGTF